jgi:hypothetical protein
MLNKFFGLCTPPKTSSYAFFMPQNKPKSQKWLLNVYTISHGPGIFAHIQVGGLGGSGGGGKAAKEGKSLFMTKLRPFICRLSASQTSEQFLPEIKDLGF